MRSGTRSCSIFRTGRDRWDPEAVIETRWTKVSHWLPGTTGHPALEGQEGYGASDGDTESAGIRNKSQGVPEPSPAAEVRQRYLSSW